MKVGFFLAVCLGIVVIQRVVELFIAAKNRRVILDRGGIEFGREHYIYIVSLHIFWLIAWPVEVFIFGGEVSTLWPLWTFLLIVAQILRYCAIFTLGEFWNTRIIVLPGSSPIKKGIYRYIRHPNYWAVAIELAAFPLLFKAYLTASICSIVNAYLLIFVRIPNEERALREAEVGFPARREPWENGR